MKKSRIKLDGKKLLIALIEADFNYVDLAKLLNIDIHQLLYRRQAGFESHEIERVLVLLKLRIKDLV